MSPVATFLFLPMAVAVYSLTAPAVVDSSVHRAAAARALCPQVEQTGRLLMARRQHDLEAPALAPSALITIEALTALTTAVRKVTVAESPESKTHAVNRFGNALKDQCLIALR